MPFYLLCSGWRDPLNVGSAFRLADAAGLQLILSDGSPEPPHPKIARTARSTHKSVNWSSVESGKDFLLDFRRMGPSAIGQASYKAPALPTKAFVLALEITDSSTSLLNYQLPKEVLNGEQALCLVPGSEVQGVPQEILDLCDASVHLPMYGQNSSMNVSVALGAAVYLLLAAWQ